MSRVAHASSSSSSSMATAKVSPLSWWRPSVLLSPSRLLSALFPSIASPLELLERLLLAPLELYEATLILPVSFLRRHMPVFGGTLVVLMTLHGLVLRLVLDGVRVVLARLTFSADIRYNYSVFWRAMRDRYTFPNGVDWRAVHRVFGAPLATTTSDDDLWLALHESIALCDDPALRVTRAQPLLTAYGRPLHSAQRLQYEHAAMDLVRRCHLTDRGHTAANHMVYGILNAETSPGWRIGYIALHAMDGFVDFPLPRLDALGHMWTGPASSTPPTTKSVAVPEIYDLESMRWALEAVLRALGDVDALILDVRFNRGGGSLQSALAVASFFTGDRKNPAFLTDDKVPDAQTTARFYKKRKHYVPRCRRRYSGPMVVLQSPYTRGTAEVLLLSLMNRPQTCRIGAPSAGSLAQTRKLRLPNGWTVDIPYQRCFSAKGELFEGTGVPVDKTVDTMEAAVATHDGFDPCIKTAIDHIMNV